MPLINIISEYKKYIAIDANTKVASLNPFRDEAEQLYMVDLLGQSFYDELAAAYAAAAVITPNDPFASLSAPNKLLFPLIQRALAYYTLLLAMPHLNVTVGELGTRQHRGEDSDPAPRWKEEKMLISYLKSADTHADKLLAYLEANASGSNYATWFNSASNTKKSGIVVYSTAIASKHIDINESRRIYKKLLPKIKEVEVRIVAKQLGDAQYQEIVTQLKAGTLSNNNKLLTDLMEPIIAKRALYMQLPFMRVQIDGGGLWLYSDLDEVRKKDFLADKDSIEELREQLEGDEDDAIGFIADEARLNQYLLDNIDTYPLVKASGIYTSQPDPGPTWRPADPNPDDKFFVV
jgi:hypothetical protein